MTRPRLAKPAPKLLVLSEEDCATQFGKGETWFRTQVPALEVEGFPKVDALLGGRNALLVEEWFRSRKVSGTMKGDEDLEMRLEAMRNG